MKSILIVICFIGLIGCNKVNNIYDSQIAATRDQTEVLKQLVEEQKKQNEILQKLVESK